MSHSIKDNAAKDLELWDCAKMYPPPVRTTMNWFELVTGVAK